MKHEKKRETKRNQGACRIISVGIRKPDLQKIARDSFKLFFEHNLTFNSQWIHLLRRIIDMNDLQINSSIFILMDAKWDPHTVDRFASHYNFQVSRFNSRIACPMTHLFKVRAMKLNGSVHHYLLFRWYIMHIKSCKARGTLIVPESLSAIFWIVLCDTPKNLASFIEEVFVLP